MNELRLRLPGFASPEVKSYFDDRVGGLISGAVSLEDIRQDAIGARDQLIDLKKDLGPDAAALDGYLGILEGFIRATAPAGEEASEEPASGEEQRQSGVPERVLRPRTKAPPMVDPVVPMGPSPEATLPRY
jgi:hypothetical protein